MNTNIDYIPMQLSKKVENIPEALSIYINQIVYERKRKGFDIITLSLGEAYFDIPMYDFKKLDTEKCYHYSESQGYLPLRKKLASFYKSQYDCNVDFENELLISAGSKPIIFMAMQAVLNEDDEGLIHEPAWLSYQEQLKLVGAKAKFIPYNCKAEDFYKYFTPKTRMLIINNPNNPAGWLYTKQDLEIIYSQCRSRGIYVLVDEAYSDFIAENENFYSMAKIVPDKDGVIIVNSLSKNMGMSGLRVGYVISSPGVIRQMLKLNQHLLTCASTIVLHYVTKYFDNIIKKTLPQVKDLNSKRAAVKKYLDKLNLKYLNGNNTFYYFVDIENFPSSSLDLSLYLLLKYNIATVPGDAYGASTERFIRISIGTESLDRIHDALLTIKNTISLNKFNKNELDFILCQQGVKRFEYIKGY
ncbi:TPA: pyridoxal phosphate-dependent aminotransferase [Candidatus Galligastranaerophilus faecipullorum]|nr:pyridoxal phosphate-dependent aminotransferase [Candidatus Galligastranaerophilus faecipullorum]